MSKPLCIIVGIDGLDPDVLANQIAFYGACDYEVRIRPAPQDCELLVVQRGSYSGQVFETRASACHIYDYAAHGTSDFHRAFPGISRCVVIAPSERVSGQWIPARQIRGIHPVMPALWRARARSAPSAALYDFVHVGHRKPNPGHDAALLQMDAVARSGRCHFWGNGWPAAPGRTMHGPASLHECQQIYRRSTFALGVMYPFQRGRTISGRMWQAPLNGCFLFSEAVLPDVTLPGVSRCADFPSALDGAQGVPDASRLVDEAADFWEDATLRLAASLELRYSTPPTLAVRSTYLKWVYARHVGARVIPSGGAAGKLMSLLR